MCPNRGVPPPVVDPRAVDTGIGYFTAFFITEDFMGGPVARDDLEEVRWFDIYDEHLDVVTEHKPLLEMLKKEYANEPNSVDRLV